MRERTRSGGRAAVVTLVFGLLLPANAHAQAQAPEPVEPQSSNLVVAGLEAGFDLVVLRPLGLVAIAVGAVAFVPVALVTAPNGRDGFQSALEVLVFTPAKSVFQRPLGDF